VTMVRLYLPLLMVQPVAPTTTPTATSLPTWTPTVTPSPTWTPTPTSTPSPTATAAGQSNIVIAHIVYDSRDEYARIENQGTAGQNMSGWRLEDVAGYVYYFPSITLAPDGFVRIHSGPDAPLDDPPTDYRWTRRYIWNNDGDTAYLYDAAGRLVDTYSY